MKNLIQRTGLYTLIMLMLTGAAQAQPSAHRDMGDRYYRQFNFNKALIHYRKAYKRHPEDKHLMQQLADGSRLLGRWKDAEQYYAALMKAGDRTAVNWRYYALSLQAQGKYAMAQKYLEAYHKEFPEDSSVHERIHDLANVPQLARDRGLYSIRNLKEINTPASEFGVSLQGRDKIYFTSNRKEDAYVRRDDSWSSGSFLEMYVANIHNSSVSAEKAEIAAGKRVNGRYHEGNPFYVEKRNELWFDRSNYSGRKVHHSADKTVKLKLYKVDWLPDQKKWNGKVEEAVPFNSDEYSVCHPSLSPSGDTLYFASDMPGGYGRTDVYMATRSTFGSWRDPVNLGPGVNTSEDDLFPFYAEDGNLFFASTGHAGLGGLDIFSTHLHEGQWSKPKNLGAPVNSSEDDFNYVIRDDNRHGYFSSNRPGGEGNDDLYTFEKKTIIIPGLVYHAVTGEPIPGATLSITPPMSCNSLLTAKDGRFSCEAEPNREYTIAAGKSGFHQNKIAFTTGSVEELQRIPLYPIGDIELEVTVQDKKTREKLEYARIRLTELNQQKQQVGHTDKNGVVRFVLDTSSRYRMEVSKETGEMKERYLAVSRETETKGVYPPAKLKELVELERVKLGVPIRVENIYYDFNQWHIRPDAAIELNRLVKILADNPEMEIELSAHTDCRGSDKFNQNLSQKRAQSAVDYIAGQGIKKERMKAAGYGESRPAAKCSCEGKKMKRCTDEQHDYNRRTEFKVTKF